MGAAHIDAPVRVLGDLREIVRPIRGRGLAYPSEATVHVGSTFANEIETPFADVKRSM